MVYMWVYDIELVCVEEEEEEEGGGWGGSRLPFPRGR